MHDKNDNPLQPGDWVKFKPRADAPYEIGKVAHAEGHKVAKRDAQGNPIQKTVEIAPGNSVATGGIETEDRVGQILHIRGQATELVYFDPKDTELILKADGSAPAAATK